MVSDDDAIRIVGLRRRFGAMEALKGVDLAVGRGQIHALLGPNGAGKTTLLRILTGLVSSDGGEITVLGQPVATIGFRRYHRLFGLVPSGDRSFYLRISGFENLLFFGRLMGMSKARATERAYEYLRAVGLEDAAAKPVGLYSHGMQKRLSVARGLLGSPAVLFVDEATHDLDPEGARRVQDLVAAAARTGTATIWTTQRLDEIRGFADRVTVLDRGEVRFVGTVPELMATSMPRRYVVRLRDPHGGPIVEAVTPMLGDLGVLSAGGGRDHYVLALTDRASLGAALQVFLGGGLEVLSCTEERSGLEQSFLDLVQGPS